MFRVFSVMILGLLLHFGGQIPGQEDELPPNPEMQREEIVNLEKEAARAIQTNTGTFFSNALFRIPRPGMVLCRYSPMRW